MRCCWFRKATTRITPDSIPAFCHMVKHDYGSTTILRKSCVYCNWNPKGLLRGKIRISCFHASLASSSTPIPRHSSTSGSDPSHCLQKLPWGFTSPSAVLVVKFVKMVTRVVAPKWQHEHGFIEFLKVKLELRNLFSLVCKALEKETLWEDWGKSTLQIHVSLLLSLESQWRLCNFSEKIHSKWNKYLLVLNMLWQILLWKETQGYGTHKSQEVILNLHLKFWPASAAQQQTASKRSPESKHTESTNMINNQIK